MLGAVCMVAMFVKEWSVLASMRWGEVKVLNMHLGEDIMLDS